MFRDFPTRLRRLKWSLVSVPLLALSAIFFLPGGRVMTTVFAAPAPNIRVMAIPAFARKYGLPCSACHTAWPELNNFGQVFRDNGYQLMNERDSPIWQNPSYFPITFRITPNWHRESANNQQIDATPGGSSSGSTVSGRVTQPVLTCPEWTCGRRERSTRTFRSCCCRPRIRRRCGTLRPPGCDSTI